MNIAVITGNYPINFAPNRGAFVYNLLQALAAEHNITVITPLKAHKRHKYKVGGYGAERCEVIRPISFSFSNKKLFGLDTLKLTHWASKLTLTRALRGMSMQPDVIYCHFLSSALHIIDYATRKHIPVVVASGESSYDFWDRLNVTEKNKLLTGINEIISVSETNTQELVRLGFSLNKIEIIPNAVNYELFKPLNKAYCREQLGLPKDKFIVGFIGHFIERKGPNRVIQAIKKINDPNIELVCVGDGGTLEENNFTTIIPPVPNIELPRIFNSFDVFVLPTLNEGHCNVIEEAMACCIPIISSKGTSVEEQLHNGLGVLVNPKDTDKIAESIQKVKQDEKMRRGLIKNMRMQIGVNSIEKRANKINQVLMSLIY